MNEGHSLKTPVVVIVFNRPNETRLVLDEIRKARPERLLVIADGPRNQTEAQKCEEVRALISTVDWPCKIERNFAEQNMGLKNRLSSGLNWVFETVERAIILEDDCLPNQSFFGFCEEMLEKYAHDPRIMHICGTNHQMRNRKFKTDSDYFFSLIPIVCGWATWRRAWKLYDVDVTSWPRFKQTGELAKRFNNPAAYERFSRVWDMYHERSINSWDGQWTYAVIANGGLAIHPSVNLVSNIGNASGVHSEINPGKITKFGDMPTFPMILPVRNHPSVIAANQTADAYSYRHAYGVDHKLYQRMVRPLKTAFPGAFDFYRNIKRRLQSRLRK